MIGNSTFRIANIYIHFLSSPGWSGYLLTPFLLAPHRLRLRFPASTEDSTHRLLHPSFVELFSVADVREVTAKTGEVEGER